MHKSRLAVMAALSFALVVPLNLSAASHSDAAQTDKTDKSCFIFTCTTAPPTVTPGSTDAKLGPWKDDAETQAFISLRPFVKAWKKAVKDRDQAAAIAAGLEYEIHWQGPEIWTQHRTFPAYQNLEDDNQFGLDAATAEKNPDGSVHQPQWALADDYMAKMSNRLEWIILNASNGPELSPNFTHLFHVRRARANLNVTRDLLNPPIPGDPVLPNLAADYVHKFTVLWTQDNNEASNDVAFRRPSVATAITTLLTAGPGGAGIEAYLRSGATNADKLAAFTAFNARVGQGVNLVNNAARGSDAVGRWAGQVLECGNPNGKDFKNLELVKLIQLAADAGNLASNHTLVDQPNLGTGPGTPFDGLLAALEVNTKSRYQLASGTLRTALRAMTNAAPNPANFAALQLAINDQLDLVRQMLWGQFWATTGLNTCDPAPGSLASTLAAFQ